MSFIPEFEIGLWNAWIFMIFVILYNVLPYILSKIKQAYNEILKKASNPDIPLDKAKKMLGNILSIFFYIPIIYSFFLSIKISSFWFYIGLLIYFIGVIIGILAWYDFYTTAVDKLVSKGIYRFSRNPMYLCVVLIFTGTSIACISWLFLLLTIIFTILSHKLVISEEHFCLKKYGKDYQNYLNRIPRWMGLPKNK
jgi:protein-S-isoprenylcysteine O-methyltransferase Ste14